MSSQKADETFGFLYLTAEVTDSLVGDLLHLLDFDLAAAPPESGGVIKWCCTESLKWWSDSGFALQAVIELIPPAGAGWNNDVVRIDLTAVPPVEGVVTTLNVETATSPGVAKLLALLAADDPQVSAARHGEIIRLFLYQLLRTRDGWSVAARPVGG